MVLEQYYKINLTSTGGAGSWGGTLPWIFASGWQAFTGTGAEFQYNGGAAPANINDIANAIAAVIQADGDSYGTVAVDSIEAVGCTNTL